MKYITDNILCIGTIIARSFLYNPFVRCFFNVLLFLILPNVIIIPTFKSNISANNWHNFACPRQLFHRFFPIFTIVSFTPIELNSHFIQNISYGLFDYPTQLRLC